MNQNNKSIQLQPGLSVEVIKKISELKNEPEWMLNIRLAAYEKFNLLKNPTSWGPDLSFIDFDKYIYYASSLGENYYKNSWDEIPDDIKTTFEKLKVPEHEAKYFSGVNSQYDSETIYHKLKTELDDKHVIFTNIETAIKEYPELVKKYFGKLVPFSDNKYAALNTAVWSGGSFIYVPKNVKLDKPLQAYFRINTKSVGQFERTLIIVDDGAYLHYNEGCTAPIYDKNNLHAAVVEVFVGKNAHCRYSTIQNWSDNVLNLVTKRSIVDTNGIMEWIDGNLGSKLNMKYPATILKGDNSIGKCISIAVAHKDVVQDAGAKMIHIGRNTRSQIISKSIAHNGGNATYRGLVKIAKTAINSKADVTCDTLLLDKFSKSDTFPTEEIYNKHSSLKHEAKVTDLDQKRLFYLQSKGIDPITAKQLLVLGFIQPFSNELPLEYVVELNRLLKLDINK
ncbi:MAG: Fe-S cluster assembly protein SufB [Malacoplasma sp.]|nr:Fe-S cluster assembly protein SufB [Mycoplasmataceae bacterium]MDY2887803.1 Fe-S cluster assembly protein SufB [Malacoplasma sp.]